MARHATGRAGEAHLDGVHDDLETLDGKTPPLPETVTVQVPETKRENTSDGSRTNMTPSAATDDPVGGLKLHAAGNSNLALHRARLLHEHGFDGVVYVSVRGAAQQLPETHLGLLRRRLAARHPTEFKLAPVRPRTPRARGHVCVCTCYFPRAAAG